MKNANANTKRSNDEALAAFVARVEASREMVARIAQHLDDHLGVEPESVNWGHVGDAGYIQELLTQLCEFHHIPNAK